MRKVRRYTSMVGATSILRDEREVPLVVLRGNLLHAGLGSVTQCGVVKLRKPSPARLMRTHDVVHPMHRHGSSICDCCTQNRKDAPARRCTGGRHLRGHDESLPGVVRGGNRCVAVCSSVRCEQTNVCVWIVTPRAKTCTTLCRRSTRTHPPLQLPAKWLPQHQLHVMAQRIAVVGGGPAGLAFAYTLRRVCPTVGIDIFEASSRWGGWLHTAEQDGFLFERGCRGIRTSSAAGARALDLVSCLGLSAQALPAAAEANKRYIWYNGQLSQVPRSLVQAAQWPLLGSPLALLRSALSTAPALQPGEDISVRDLVTRHLGEAVADNIVDAVLSGVYAGDARQLSARSVLPFLVDWLQVGHGNLARGAVTRLATTHSAPGPEPARMFPRDPLRDTLRRASSVNFVNGMSTLPRALAGALGREGAGLHLQQPIDSLEMGVDNQSVQVCSGGERHGPYDYAVLACPAHAAAHAVQSVAATAASDLRGIPSASVSTVCMGWKSASHHQVLGGRVGFGYLVPSAQRSLAPGVLGVVWDSCAFPGQAPGDAGGVRVSVMFGGATVSGHPNSWSEGELKEAAVAALVNHLHGGDAAALPQHDTVLVQRSDNCIPQYTLGHGKRVSGARSDIARAFGGRVSLLGNSYDGVGIADTLAAAQAAAWEMASTLRSIR